MNDDEIVDNELLLCDECESEVQSEDDLLPYEDSHVCIRCYDILRLADEQDMQHWETDGYDYE